MSITMPEIGFTCSLVRQVIVSHWLVVTVDTRADFDANMLDRKYVRSRCRICLVGGTTRPAEGEVIMLPAQRDGGVAPRT